MAAIRILLGRARWRRRRATAAWTGFDALGRPDAIYVTDTRRKRDALEREAAARSRLVPEVRVLSELAHDLWERHGDGRAILGSRGTRLLASRIVADAAPGSSLRTWAGGARTEAAPAIARLARAMGEARIASPPVEAPSGLADGVRALGRAFRDHPRVIDEATAIEGVISRLADPGPSLRRRLGARRLAVIDDVVTASPLRIALVLGLVRAWADAGVDVVLAFETGRSAGGAEVGALLGFDDPPADWPAAALAAGTPLRRAVLDELVASGEASLLLATADGVEPLEPGAELEVEEPDPSDIAFGEPVSRGRIDAFPDRLRVVRAADPAGELAHVAGEVRAALAAGAPPDQCLVALPGLDARADEVAAAFADVGVPIALGPGFSLGIAPVAVAIRRIAGLGPRGCPAGDLLAVLDRRDLGGTPAATLARWTRAAGLSRTALLATPVSDGLYPPDPVADSGGWARSLAGWIGRNTREDVALVDRAVEVLDPLIASVARLARRATPSEWRAALADTVHALEPGAAPTRAAADDRGARERALGAATREIDALAADLAAVDPEPWPAAVLAVELDAALAEARIHPADGALGRVPVVGLLEVRGLAPARTWLAGLVEGDVPKPVRRSPAERAVLPIDALAEARWVVASAVRNALDDPRAVSLSLSWSERAADGEPQSPSPVLAEILAVERADGVVLAASAVSASAPEGSERQRARAAAAAVDPGDPAVAAQRPAFEARSRDAFGPWDGIDAGRRPPRELSVTALETFLRCPMRYWADRVLGLAPDTEEGLDPDRRRIGIALHRILEKFAARGGLATSGQERAGALAAAAEEALGALAAEGGIDPALASWIRDRWSAGLIDGRPRGILAAWLALEDAVPCTPIAVEQRFSGLPLGPVTLKGAIDRVDRVGGATVVLDYKSGAAPRPSEVSAGLALQPIAYLAAIEADRPGVPVAAAFLSMRRAEEMRRTGWVGDTAALDAACAPSERRWALDLDAAGRRALLEKAAVAAERLVAGRFPTTTLGPDMAGCEHCPHRALCRVDHERNRRVVESTG